MLFLRTTCGSLRITPESLNQVTSLVGLLSAHTDENLVSWGLQTKRGVCQWKMTIPCHVAIMLSPPIERCQM